MCRVFISILPAIYMSLIWLQSGRFDPESVSSLSKILSPVIVLIIGAALEFAHLFEFGILYFLIIFTFLCYGPLSRIKELLTAVISIFYGFIDEIHQIYVPFRSFSLVDLLKDLIGVLAIWYIIHKKYYSKKSRLGSYLRKIQQTFKPKKGKVPF